MLQLPQELKRGDTFYFYAVWRGVDVKQIKAQVRDTLGNVLADLKVSKTADKNIFLFTALDTSEWPLGNARMDIQRTYNGYVTSSETIKVLVVEDETR